MASNAIAQPMGGQAASVIDGRILLGGFELGIPVGHVFAVRLQVFDVPANKMARSKLEH